MRSLHCQFSQTQLVHVPVIPTRLAILFGNNNHRIQRDMAIEAARLYHKGYFKKIIVCGGVQLADLPMTEATYARRILRARNVPSSAIIVENKSTNSLENVEQSKKLILGHEKRLKHEPILCFGTSWARDRFLMTLKANWPQVTPCFIPFSHINIDNNITDKHDYFREKHQEDKSKWLDYINRGHITTIDHQDIAKRLGQYDSQQRRLKPKI